MQTLLLLPPEMASEASTSTSNREKPFSLDWHVRDRSGEFRTELFDRVLPSHWDHWLDTQKGQLDLHHVWMNNADTKPSAELHQS